jgi:hypothetical protein
MNKAKLVELAEEVLTEVNDESKNYLRECLEQKVCGKLSAIFNSAQYAANYTSDQKRQKDYASVKPILDDCIDKLLGEKNET